MKAWLITRGSSLLSALTKGEVIDILSARSSQEDVRQYVERLHNRCCLTLAERAKLAKYIRRDKPAYPAEVHFHIVPNVPKIGAVPQVDRSRSPQIYCGHDPVFAAQLVKNLVVDLDPLTGQERVIWEPWTP